MGQVTGRAKLSNQQIQQISQQTQLQPFFIQQVYEAFMDRAGKNGRLEKKNTLTFFLKNIFICLHRMTINQFKLAYPQINPNVNIYSIDLDAERTGFVLFLFLFFSLVF